jgi:hypothetical protein
MCVDKWDFGFSVQFARNFFLQIVRSMNGRTVNFVRWLCCKKICRVTVKMLVVYWFHFDSISDMLSPTPGISLAFCVRISPDVYII